MPVLPLSPFFAARRGTTVVTILLVVCAITTCRGTRNQVPQARSVSLQGLTCIPAASLGNKEAYGAIKIRFTGVIYSITLTWEHGNVRFCTSPTNAACGNAIFGPPGSTKVGIYVTGANGGILFPRTGTVGYTAGSDGFYTLSSYTSGAKTLTLKNSLSSLARVQEGEIVRLYFGDVLKQVSYADNSGSVCVTVKIMYPTVVANANIRRSNLGVDLPTESLTCIPVVGAPKSTYGAAMVNRGLARLENLTLTVTGGSSEFCHYRRCYAGTFGFGSNLAVYVTRADGTLMYPVAGKTIGYTDLPNFAGFYRMTGNKGDGNTLSFKLPRQQNFGPREVIKFEFGRGASSSSWGSTAKKGTVCVSVTAHEGPEQAASGISCFSPTISGHEYACTCGHGGCRTFEGYSYNYDSTNLQVFLVRPAPPLNLLPFTVSAALNSQGSSGVRIALDEGGANPFENYVEIVWTRVRAPTKRQSSDSQATALVEGERNTFKNGMYEFSKFNGGVTVRISFNGMGNGKGDVLVQEDGYGLVTVMLSDCYTEHLMGMCGMFKGSAYLSQERKTLDSLKVGGYRPFRDPKLLGALSNRRAKKLYVVGGMESGMTSFGGVDLGIARGFVLALACLCGIGFTWQMWMRPKNVIKNPSFDTVNNGWR